MLSVFKVLPFSHLKTFVYALITFGFMAEKDQGVPTKHSFWNGFLNFNRGITKYCLHLVLTIVNICSQVTFCLAYVCVNNSHLKLFFFITGLLFTRASLNRASLRGTTMQT